MLVKVCGMREPQNALDVCSLGVDMMGFIFFDRSPRFVDSVAPSTVGGVARVGVFVDESLGSILALAGRNGLTHIQLHGAESAELCLALRDEGFVVMKAISISNGLDLQKTSDYLGCVDMFVFDTKCSGYGGSGKRFDWSLLDQYTLDTPFLLSGGIDHTMAHEILSITHPRLLGVDLNSRFESSAALKNIEQLKQFITQINDNE
ncbi:MAG: phosphoribosylanthranilate isomerase [Rikenellaceae bacterium]